MTHGRKSLIATSGLGPAVEAMRRGGASMAEIANALGVSQPQVKTYLRSVQLRENPVPDIGLAPDLSSMSALEVFRAAFEMEPTDWQVAYLTDESPLLLLRKGRQIGATQAGAALALCAALSGPGRVAAIVSPVQRQSTEVTTRARTGAWNLGLKLAQDSASMIRFANNSRIISLPGSPRTIRGIAANLLVLDEAAFILDETFAAARPMTTATDGRTIVQSTPAGPFGPFYDMNQRPDPTWRLMVVRSEDVPTVDRAKIEEARRTLDPHEFRQEYEAEFGSMGGGGALFDAERIARMILPNESVSP